MPDDLNGWSVDSDNAEWKVDTLAPPVTSPVALSSPVTKIAPRSVGGSDYIRPHNVDASVMPEIKSPNTAISPRSVGSSQNNWRIDTPKISNSTSSLEDSSRSQLPEQPEEETNPQNNTQPQITTPALKPSTSKQISTLYFPKRDSVSKSVAIPAIPANPQLTLPEDANKNSILVNLSTKRVQVIDPSGKVIRDYPAYVGMSSNPTPEGQFKILNNLTGDDVEPYYANHFLAFKKEDHPELGGDWIWGFHGWKYNKTTKEMQDAEPDWTPEMWGNKTQTHGCIQLDNNDVAEFSTLVSPGSNVRIISK